MNAAESGTSPRDDPAIPDSDALLRRLSDSSPSMIARDLETNEPRPSSGAFKPDADGVSVYRRGVLESVGLGPDDVMRDPWNLVVSVEVGDVRSIRLGVVDDPCPSDVDEPQHPRNEAHALITGLEALGKKERRRRQRLLVVLPSVAIIRGTVTA